MPDSSHQTQSIGSKKRTRALTNRLWCLIEHYLEQLEKLLSQQQTTPMSNTLAREIGALVTTLDRLAQLDCTQSALTNSEVSPMKRTRKTSKTKPNDNTERDEAELKRQQLLMRLEKWAQSIIVPINDGQAKPHDKDNQDKPMT